MDYIKPIYRDFAVTDLVTLEEVKRLVQFKYPNPVISLYLNLDPLKVRNKNYLSTFRSLLTQEKKRQAKFIEGLSREAKKTLDADIEAIEEFLENRFRPEGLRTLALFTSGKDLKFVLHLPVRLYHPDRLVIDHDPYITPLVSLFNKHPRILAIHVSKEETVLYRYQLGIFEKIKRIKHSALKLTDKTLADKIQQQQLARLRRYFREVIRLIVNLHHQEHFNKLLVMGTKHTTSVFLSTVPDHLSKRIIGTITLKPETTEGTVKQEVEKAINKYLENLELEQAKIIEAHFNKGELIYGKEAILKAQNDFIIKKLWVASTANWPGYICPIDHYMSTQPQKCPYCQKQLQPAENLIDELVERASVHHIDFYTFDFHPELLDKFDGAAALVY